MSENTQCELYISYPLISYGTSAGNLLRGGRTPWTSPERLPAFQSGAVGHHPKGIAAAMKVLVAWSGELNSTKERTHVSENDFIGGARACVKSSIPLWLGDSLRD